METDINKDFIFMHFARKTSALQRELITQWLKNRTNEEWYYEWRVVTGMKKRLNLRVKKGSYLSRAVGL